MNLGAERLGGLARRLEEIGRGGDLGDAPAVLRDLEEEFAGVRAEALRLADRAEAA